MDSDTLYYISLFATLGALLGLNLFFSLCETSFSALSRIKLKNMAAQTGSKAIKRKAVRASLVLHMTENYDKLLSSILIGNTIVNITASALAAVLFFELFGSAGVGVATAALTLIVLLFCEISPKTLAKESPEVTAMRVAPFMRFFIVIFSPLNYLTGAWKKIIIKIFPVKDDQGLTEDELLTFVEEVRQEGGINKNEEEMIRQAIEFDDLTAAQICTPRMDIAAVCETYSVNDIDTKFAQTGFSRLPVYHESIDNITGVILLKDFHHEVINRGKPIASVMKPTVFVTKTIKISRLLKTMQRKCAHMAVVVDEFGGTLGIVTIEDIVEELVGEIWDEHDEIIEPVIDAGDGNFRVMGNTTLPVMFEFIRDHEKKPDEVEGTLAAAVSDEPSATADDSEDIAPEDEAIPNITMGSWALEKLGEVPRQGDEFQSHGLHVTVSRVLRHRVMEAIVRKV